MKKNENGGRNFFLSCVLAQIAWAASTVVLLLIFCAAAYSTADPDSITKPLSLCALYLSSVIGGGFAVRLSDDGLASGCVSGLITAAIIFCLSALPLPTSGFDLITSVILIALIIPASVLGAVIRHKKDKKPKKIKHSRPR